LRLYVQFVPSAVSAAAKGKSVPDEIKIVREGKISEDSINFSIAHVLVYDKRLNKYSFDSRILYTVQYEKAATTKRAQ
jgi:hypothetical protein